MQPFKITNTKGFSALFPLVLALMITISLLSACSKDPVERANYADLLKAEILSKSNFHSLPELNDEQRAAIGSKYTASYEILMTYSRSMEKSVERVAKAMNDVSSKITTPQDIMRDRATLVKARDEIAALPAEWDGYFKQAKQGADGLDLHEEVAELYNEAFVRLTQPASKIKEVTLAVIGALDSNIALADYLESHKDKIKFNGSMIIAEDEAVHEKINELLADMAERANELYSLESSLSKYMVIGKD